MHESHWLLCCWRILVGPLWVHLHLWFLKFAMTLKARGQFDTLALVQNANEICVHQSPGSFVSNGCQALAIVFSADILSFGVFKCSGQSCFGITCCWGCQTQAQRYCWHKPGKQCDRIQPGRNRVPVRAFAKVEMLLLPWYSKYTWLIERRESELLFLPLTVPHWWETKSSQFNKKL